MKSVRTLWVDAVCVNQEDNDEKMQQVSQIRDIYMSARRVLVWLGERRDAAIAVAFCTNLKVDEVRLGTELQIHMAACHDLFCDPERRPWWFRCWILQQFLDPGDVTVHTGEIQISLDDLISHCHQYRMVGP
jgi:hypothetical protein